MFKILQKNKIKCTKFSKRFEHFYWLSNIIMILKSNNNPWTIVDIDNIQWSIFEIFGDQ